MSRKLLKNSLNMLQVSSYFPVGCFIVALQLENVQEAHTPQYVSVSLASGGIEGLIRLQAMN